MPISQKRDTGSSPQVLLDQGLTQFIVGANFNAGVVGIQFGRVSMDGSPADLNVPHIQQIRCRYAKAGDRLQCNT
jgi:hypothetical protein